MMQESSYLPRQDLLPILETPRLVLRPMEMGDSGDVFAYAMDPDVLRYTTGVTPRHVGETESFLRGALAAAHDRMWAIRLRESPRVIGAIELGLASPQSGSVHFALGKPYWNRGLMTEALQAICEWAFAAIAPLREITTAAIDANFGSIRVLEKCGFEGTGMVEERWEKETAPVRLVLFRRVRA